MVASDVCLHGDGLAGVMAAILDGFISAQTAAKDLDAAAPTSLLPDLGTFNTLLLSNLYLGTTLIPI